MREFLTVTHRQMQMHQVEEMGRARFGKRCPGKSTIHVANFDPQTAVLIANPVRRFKGFIKGLDFTRPALGGEAKCEMAVQSAARVLTRTLPLKKSDGALRGRHAADGFRKYADLSGAIETAWGELRRRTRS